MFVKLLAMYLLLHLAGHKLNIFGYNDFTLLHYMHRYIHKRKYIYNYANVFHVHCSFGKTIQTKVAILLSSDLAVSAVNGWQVTV